MAKTHHRAVKTPVVMQMQATECGAACLTSILAHHGYWIELKEVAESMAINRDGANLLQIKKSAQGFGLEAKGKMVTLMRLAGIKPPFIAFWDKNHFVVVESVTDKSIRINNPAVGRQRLSMEEAARHYTGFCLELTPGENFRKHGERPSTTRRLLALYKGPKKAALIIAAYALLLVFPGLTLAATLKSFVDDVLIQQTNTWIFPLILLLIAATLLNVIFTYQQNKYLLKLQTKLSAQICGDFYNHLLRLPISYFSQRSPGDLISRVGSCHNVAALLAGPFSLGFAHLISAGIYALVMFYMDVRLALAAIAITALNIAVIWLTQNIRAEKSAATLSHQATLAGVSISSLQAIETLKATGSESEFLAQQWLREETRTVNASQQFGLTNQYLGLAPGIAHVLSIAAILGFGSALIISSDLSIGILLGFQTLMGQFANSVQSVLGLAASVQQATADIQRLNDVNDSALDVRETLQHAAQPERLEGTLSVENLSFQYTENSPWVLEDVSFTMNPGDRIAIVGRSGCGKSTLGKVIQGLLQPQKGRVRLADKLLEDIDNASLAASIGSIDQDIFLFEGSISDNLSLWDTSLPMPSMIQAAKDACIHQDIIKRPGGYSARVAEFGTNFSGGQGQRMEIARALARDPSLLILDEATASLDALTEKQIDNNLRKRGISCLIIAHRLSTIKDCDHILVLEGGKIVEQGSHQDLIGMNGRYAALVNAQ